MGNRKKSEEVKAMHRALEEQTGIPVKDTDVVGGTVPPAEISVAKPEPLRAINVGPDDNIESLTVHHYAKGLKAGQVNKHELQVCMEMLINHVITFSGAYHDKKRADFYKHLAGHYVECGLIVPALK